MAKRETITTISRNFLSGVLEEIQEPCLNVSDTVGDDGANKTGDVVLIQAMFQYIVNSAFNRQLDTQVFRAMLDPKKDIPEPTGNFDTATAHAIKLYQRIHARSLLRVDGVIHPAAYEDRRIKIANSGSTRFMTITLLHFDLMLSSPPLGVDYTIDITRRFPQLLPFL